MEEEESWLEKFWLAILILESYGIQPLDMLQIDGMTTA